MQVKWTPGLFAISVSVEGRNTLFPAFDCSSLECEIFQA